MLELCLYAYGQMSCTILEPKTLLFSLHITKYTRVQRGVLRGQRCSFAPNNFTNSNNFAPKYSNLLKLKFILGVKMAKELISVIKIGHLVCKYRQGYIYSFTCAGQFPGHIKHMSEIRDDIAEFLLQAWSVLIDTCVILCKMMAIL